VIAARSPADAFECAIEACRIATHYMTPVMLLTDGYIANAAEPWRVPDMSNFQPFPVKFFDTPPEEGRGVMPYARGDGLARPWIKPGTPGLEHRIGGIEKQPGTGNIDYRPEVHQEMSDTRAAKVLGVANAIPDQEVCLGREGAELAVVGWGSTFGPIHQAVRRAIAKGQDVAHVHVRHIWPMPRNMSVLLKGFKHILVPEMNMGQYKTLLRYGLGPCLRRGTGVRMFRMFTVTRPISRPTPSRSPPRSRRCGRGGPTLSSAIAHRPGIGRGERS
jgi:2-oxoglutarate ferredoxin oxidoreductase subunit alpha